MRGVSIFLILSMTACASNDKPEELKKMQGRNSLLMRTCFKSVDEMKKTFLKNGFGIKYASQFILETEWKKSTDQYKKPIVDILGSDIDVKYTVASKNNLERVVWNEHLKGSNGKTLTNTFYFMGRNIDGSRGSALRAKYCLRQGQTTGIENPGLQK